MYGGKNYVIIKYSRVNEELPYSFRCTKINFHIIIINIIFVAAIFVNLTGLLNFCKNLETKNSHLLIVTC